LHRYCSAVLDEDLEIGDSVSGGILRSGVQRGDICFKLMPVITTHWRTTVPGIIVAWLEVAKSVVNQVTLVKATFSAKDLYLLEESSERVRMPIKTGSGAIVPSRHVADLRWRLIDSIGKWRRLYWWVSEVLASWRLLLISPICRDEARVRRDW
jgi:hypothetical protein